MTHNRGFAMSLSEWQLSAVFRCVCVCLGKMVKQEQEWCQSGNNGGGNCPLCRGGTLGNNGGVALVVGWLVVGTQCSGYYPPAIRLTAPQIWRCDRQ